MEERSLPAESLFPRKEGMCWRKGDTSPLAFFDDPGKAPPHPVSHSPSHCLCITQRNYSRATLAVSLARPHLSPHSAHGERDGSSGEMTNSLTFEDRVSH